MGVKFDSSAFNSEQLEDMSKPVYKTTLTGAANAITITTDLNGKALALTRAELRIIVPADVPPLQEHRHA